MLVLTRKKGEEIVLSPGTRDQVIVRIVRIKGTSVRIGIEAGGMVKIVRRELLEGGDDETA